MQVSYDTDADAIYVRFPDAQGAVRTESIDDLRMVDRDDDGVVGVELLAASRGLNLKGLPEADEIAVAILRFRSRLNEAAKGIPMNKIEQVAGNAIPLNRADVDTDQIIPKQFLKRIERTGFGEFAFFDWKKDPNFITNDERYRGAPILLAQQNFGCGSSREHAVWAIEDMGVTAIIAPSFGDIFRTNCSKVGLVTVQLPQEDIDYLMSRAEELPGGQIVVDVAQQTVSVPGTSWQRSFQIDPFVKYRLLNGLDDVGLTLRHVDAITEFESRRDELKPTTELAFASPAKYGP